MRPERLHILCTYTHVSSSVQIRTVHWENKQRLRKVALYFTYLSQKTKHRSNEEAKVKRSMSIFSRRSILDGTLQSCRMKNVNFSAPRTTANLIFDLWFIKALLMKPPIMSNKIEVNLQYLSVYWLFNLLKPQIGASRH